MTAEEREAWERYQTYMKGWRHGTSTKPMDPVFSEHKRLGETYKAGYTDGYKARVEASNKAAKHFGYVPSVLRLCDK